MAAKTAILGLAALAFATWAVYLGGIAATQNWACDNAEAFRNDPLSCSKLYRYDWWLISYEIVIIFIAVAVAAKGHMEKAGNAVLALFAIAATLYTVRTDTHLNELSRIDNMDVTGEILNNQRTVVAGLIMTATVNFLVAIAAGISEAACVPSHEAPAKAAEVNAV